MKLHNRHSESVPSLPARSFFPSRRRAAPPFFQTKLKVGQAGDRFEQEADRVAEQVVAGGAVPPVQKMCAECAAEKEEEEPLRRQPAGGLADFAGASVAPVQRQSAADQLLQRKLLSSGSCGTVASLPIKDLGQAARRGANYSETFTRPSSGKVKITVDARAEEGCHPDNTFGVNVVQCHVLSDENLDEQRIARFGATITYEPELPKEGFTTYEKFYLRIYLTCAATVDVRVEAVP